MGTVRLVRDVFSDKSSDTEYTSSSEAVTAQDKENCVESHRCFRRDKYCVGDPAPSTTFHGVRSETIIIDLGDSDEEAKSQDDDVLEVQIPTLSLVVDLADNIVAPVSSEHNGRQVEAKKDLVMESRLLSALGQPKERVLPAVKESEDEARVTLGQPEERALPAVKESEDEARVILGQPEERALPAVKESEDEARVTLGQPEERALPAVKESEDEARVTLGQPEERVIPAAKESEDEAKFLMSLREECAFPTAEESEDEASTISGNYKSGPGSAEVFPPDWSECIICDMCDRGPSLSLGAWYNWCCGKPSLGCDCTYEERQQ